MLSAVSQTEKVKYYVISNSQNHGKRHQTLVVTRGRGWREGELEEGGGKVQTPVTK